MSEAILEQFSCASCARSFAWKPELAGRRVKCKCGAALTVPQSVKSQDVEGDADGMYDFAAIEEAEAVAARKATARADADALHQPRIMPIAHVAAVAPSARAIPAGVAQPLGYRTGQTQRQLDRAAELNAALMDMTRDVYVPAALLVIGLGLYVANYAIAYHLGSTAVLGVSVGLGVMTAIKAALLIVFALVVAGPLGVSFGSPFTAALKLAAIAVFSDGCTAWIGTEVAKMSAGFGASMITFPISLGIYWILLIQLFSMDSGDSWTVVVLLTICDRILGTIVILLLLQAVLGVGGVARSAVKVPTFGASSNTAPASSQSVYVDRLKQFKMLKEAKAYIADGHQAFLSDTVNKIYAAGAPDVSFEVSRDINGKGGPVGLFVDMPQSTAARKKVLDICKAFYTANKIGDPAELIDDPQERYIHLDIR